MTVGRGDCGSTCLVLELELELEVEPVLARRGMQVVNPPFDFFEATTTCSSPPMQVVHHEMLSWHHEMIAATASLVDQWIMAVRIRGVIAVITNKGRGVIYHDYHTHAHTHKIGYLLDSPRGSGSMARFWRDEA